MRLAATSHLPYSSFELMTLTAFHFAVSRPAGRGAWDNVADAMLGENLKHRGKRHDSEDRRKGAVVAQTDLLPDEGNKREPGIRIPVARLTMVEGLPLTPPIADVIHNAREERKEDSVFPSYTRKSAHDGWMFRPPAGFCDETSKVTKEGIL